jgi:proteic killer suppression protein
MELEFKDCRLAKVEEGGAANYKASGAPLEIIDSLRRKLHFLREAPDEQSIRNWKSLHYEKLKGNREGQRSIRLNNKWRLIFTLDESQNPRKIVILGVEDYH